MDKYYKEAIWNCKTGSTIIRVFERGSPKHICIFYNEDLANDYLKYLNS